MSDRVILATARELLARLRRARPTPARLLGVGLSGLAEGEFVTQMSLFEETPAPEATETARDRALAGAVDTLRAKFGADAVIPGRLAERAGERASERAAERGRRAPNR